jgi:hypothetical protein
MDSVTRGSGIVLSVLIAATASILLLLPGQPAGSWRGPGTSGRAVMAWSAATSTSGMPGPGSQPTAGGQPAARPRSGCDATSAAGGRPRPGLTSRLPGLQPGLQPGQARFGAAHAGSCRLPGAHRYQHASRRLSRYRGIRPGLP